MRKLLATGSLFACLFTPAFAQTVPVAKPAEVLPVAREHLLRVGSRLKVLNEKQHLFEKICNVASAEQLETLNRLRISPSQAMALVKLVQENLPAEGLTRDGWPALRKQITPKAEDILGSEQFDMLLELVPSPQQTERVKSILRDAASTPEGQQLKNAVRDLNTTLNAQQQRFLAPFLELSDQTKPESGKATPKSKAASKKPLPSRSAALPEERRLVLLKTNVLGDSYAELLPSNNFTTHLPSRLRVEGADPDILKAMSSEAGLAVRLLGNYRDDVVTVAKTRFVGLPPLVDASAATRVWRGRVPAHVVSQNPAIVELNLGLGRRLKAELEFQNSAEKAAFSKAGSDFLVAATCLEKPESARLVDLEFLPLPAPPSAPVSAALVQISEEFLAHAAQEFVEGNKTRFSGSSGALKVGLKDVGVTMLGCGPGQVRLYGSVSGSHSGLEVVEAQFELVAQTRLEKGKAQLVPVPGSMQARLSYPLRGEVPAHWLKRLETIMGKQYAEGLSVTLPDSYREPVTRNNLLQATQLDQIQLTTFPTPDRRTSLAALTIPAVAGQGGATDPLRSRIQEPGECVIAIAGETINAALSSKIPSMLPILRPIPEDMRQQNGVTLSQVEITELDVDFHEGVFRIKNCALSVHWSYALFSGVEPGCRFSGTCKVEGGGDPLKTLARLQIQNLEWLSPRIKESSPQEQQDLKDKLIKTLNERPFELPSLEPLAVGALSPRARLRLTAISSSAQPNELLLQGRLDP